MLIAGKREIKVANADDTRAWCGGDDCKTIIIINFRCDEIQK